MEVCMCFKANQYSINEKANSICWPTSNRPTVVGIWSLMMWRTNGQSADHCALLLCVCLQKKIHVLYIFAEISGRIDLILINIWWDCAKKNKNCSGSHKIFHHMLRKSLWIHRRPLSDLKKAVAHKLAESISLMPLPNCQSGFFFNPTEPNIALTVCRRSAWYYIGKQCWTTHFHFTEQENRACHVGRGGEICHSLGTLTTLLDSKCNHKFKY